jgi:hypothetical protein
MWIVEGAYEEEFEDTKGLSESVNRRTDNTTSVDGQTRKKYTKSMIE